MTHSAYILSAYLIAFGCLGLLLLKSIVTYNFTKKEIKTISALMEK